MAPFSVFAFGDSLALAQELATLALAGRKTATASLPVQFADEGAPLPQAGDLSVVTLWDGTPVSLEWWRAAHRAFLGRVLARPGGDPLKDTSVVVCERFRLVHGGDQ